MILGKTKLFVSGVDGLTSNQHKVLNLFYAPLMEPLGIRLYMLLITLNNLGLQLDYSLIAKLLNSSLDEIELARIDCEKVLLIKTYADESSHTILLAAPKCALAFVEHALLGRLFLQQLGPQHLKLVNSLFTQNNYDITDKQDISQSIHLSHLDKYDVEMENRYQKEVSSIQHSNFDMNVFLTNVGEAVFPKALRTKENLKVISDLAKNYHLTINQTKLYIARCVNVKGDQLDLKKLKSLVSNELIKITSTDANPLNWTTSEFLQSKMGDVGVNENVLSAIDSIRQKYRWEDSVLNVMVDYAINNNNGVITKSYLEMLASAMRLNKVKNQQDAINHFAFSKPSKRKKSKPIIKREDYSQEEHNTNVNQEAEKELQKVLESWK